MVHGRKYLPDNELLPCSQPTNDKLCLTRNPEPQISPNFSHVNFLWMVNYCKYHSTAAVLLRSGQTCDIAGIDWCFSGVRHMSVSVYTVYLQISFVLNGIVLQRSLSLSDRTQQIAYSGQLSIVQPVFYGVPQGSVLAPLLYILYMAELHWLVERHGVSLHLYLSMPVRQWLQSASHLILSLMSVIGSAILGCGSMMEVMWLGSSQQVDKIGIKEMSVKSTHVLEPLRHCLACHWYYAVPTQLPNTEAATCTLAAGNKLTTLTFSVFGRASFHLGDDCQLVAILDDRLWGPLSDWSVSHHTATPHSMTDQRTMAGTTCLLHLTTPDGQ